MIQRPSPGPPEKGRGRNPLQKFRLPIGDHGFRIIKGRDQPVGLERRTVLALGRVVPLPAANLVKGSDYPFNLCAFFKKSGNGFSDLFPPGRVSPNFQEGPIVFDNSAFSLMSVLIGFIFWDRRTDVSPIIQRTERMELALKQLAIKNPEVSEALRQAGLL